VNSSAWSKGVKSSHDGLLLSSSGWRKVFNTGVAESSCKPKSFMMESQSKLCNAWSSRSRTA